MQGQVEVRGKGREGKHRMENNNVHSDGPRGEQTKRAIIRPPKGGRGVTFKRFRMEKGGREEGRKGQFVCVRSALLDALVDDDRYNGC